MKISSTPLGLAALAFDCAGSVASAATTAGDSLSTPSQVALGASLLKTFLSLGLVIVALALGLRLFARWNRAVARAHPRALIEVLDSRRLEAKRALHVVRVEGRRWLVASGEGGISLTPLGADPVGDADASAVESAPRAARFAELLVGFGRGGRA